MQLIDKPRFAVALKRLMTFFGEQSKDFMTEYWNAFQHSRVDAIEFGVDRIMATRERRQGFPLPGDLRLAMKDWEPKDTLLLPAGEPTKKDFEKVAKFMKLLGLRMRKKGGISQAEFEKKIKEVTSV